ncbi:hypothetical protein ACHAXA_008433 [Cyclostephanos tholiformis]|uniref:DNA replication licensing factor MCM2 n=1 Tax=Cyclostephanos tholiformis TaxID=382380 RepID=A0ABD3SBJ8_9STRA
MTNDPMGPTGPYGETTKRRRIDEDDDEDDEEEEVEEDREDGGGGGDADATTTTSSGADVNADRRRRLIEARSADRRRRRLQAEAAELRNASFPGDEFYVGEQMREVPDPNVLGDGDDDDGDAEPGGRNDENDDDDDDDDLNDFVDADDGYGESGGEDDGDYVDDGGGGDGVDDAALFFGTNRGRRKGGVGKRRRRRREGDDDDDEEEEDDDGEDLLEDALRDYQPIAALDTYGREGIDDRDYDDLDADERAMAERVLDERDRERRRRFGGIDRGGRSGGFYGALEEQLEGEVEEDIEGRRRRRGLFGGIDDDDYDDEDGAGRGGEGRRRAGVDEDVDLDDFEGQEEVNLEAFDVPLREWIAQDKTRREVQRKFRVFLSTFREGEEDLMEDDPAAVDREGVDAAESRKRRARLLARTPPTYEERIRHMCSSNGAALEVSYLHLVAKQPTLALWISEAPRDVLDVLNEAATRHALRLFPSYHAIRDEIHVRVSDVPIVDSLRDLRRNNLDGLVKVSGVITRRSGVFPQLKLAYYDCMRCKFTTGPYRIEDATSHSSGPGDGGNGGRGDISDSHSPTLCPECDSDGPFRLNPTRSRYRNYQRVNLQERPGSVPPGRVPRTKEVVFLDDLVDIARPGEEVEVTGVFCSSYDYHLTNRSGFPVFQTYVLANHVRKREDASSASNLSEADRKLILGLAADPNIGKRIVASIAPSIYGLDHVKMALAMALFGAVPKNIDDKHRIRGDVNVLILGDPGTAKSQMLKYAEATAPRAVYSTGKGASAVGLTASVHKDPLTKEWTLEGGALVLADRGVCLIDEFDKMNEQDRTSIHEAMEQQSISVSKAGIVTSLQARCSVIAAANPIGGRYDSSCTLAENVELTDPILQRFDCLCVLQDVVDPVSDERLASFVTESHMMSVPTSDVARGRQLAPERARLESADGVDSGDLIPQALLRKYIQYARANCRPALRGGTFDQEKLRKESTSSGGVPIAVRHIESIMRMSEAHAKMHLRDYVRDDDMDASIKMMLESFISAQKFSVRRSLRRSFAKFMSSGEDRVHLLLHILQDMMRNEAMYQTIRQRQLKDKRDAAVEVLEVPLEEFESRARDRRIYDVADFCKGQEFEDAGYTLDMRRRLIVRNYA